MIFKNNEHQKMVGFLAVVILLIVLVIFAFDLGMAMKAFLGTVILGLVCLVRALLDAMEVPEDMDIDQPLRKDAAEQGKSVDCATSTEKEQPVTNQVEGETATSAEDSTTNP